MTVTALTRRLPRELAFRAGDGLEVTLFWHEDTDDLSVAVWDQRRRTYFELRPDPERALDAFYHPYLHVELSVVHYEAEPLAA